MFRRLLELLGDTVAFASIIIVLWVALVADHAIG